MSEKGIDYLPLTVAGVDRIVAGGPYPNKLPGYLGVKMASEIKLPAWQSVPTEDFGLPDPRVVELAARQVFKALNRGDCVYVGCAAGRGRTGTFLAVLAKACLPGDTDPVAYVRHHYKQAACETPAQKRYAQGFDVRALKRALLWLRIKRVFTVSRSLWPTGAQVARSK